jgi:hypothetical protein
MLAVTETLIIIQMKRKTVNLILLSLVTCFLSCKKLQLTEATKKGEHTFSCIVDGKVFIPKQFGWFSSRLLEVYVSGDELTIDAFYPGGSNEPGERVVLHITDINRKGKYPLNKSPSYGYYEINLSGAPKYITNDNYGGSVTITRYDRPKGIYSGKFHFSAIDTVTGRVIKVSSGRFDVKEQ